jgi:hypothetical protein
VNKEERVLRKRRENFFSREKIRAGSPHFMLLT